MVSTDQPSREELLEAALSLHQILEKVRLRILPELRDVAKNIRSAETRDERWQHAEDEIVELSRAARIILARESPALNRELFTPV